MISAGWLPILAIIIPVCVIIGWLAATTGNRLDARHYQPRPVRQQRPAYLDHYQEPEREVVESYRPTGWDYQRELAPRVVNNHYYLGANAWPQRPPVAQRAHETREITS